jgi:SulP family sulfate permease
MAQGIANIVTPLLRRHPGHRNHRAHRDQHQERRHQPGRRHGACGHPAGRDAGAAPLASHVPLASLAAILMFVAWNMGEWREFVRLRHYRMPYRITLLAVPS